jgi:hypothetical protein
MTFGFYVSKLERVQVFREMFREKLVGKMNKVKLFWVFGKQRKKLNQRCIIKKEHCYLAKKFYIRITHDKILKNDVI